MMRPKSEILTVDAASQRSAASQRERMSVVVIEDFDVLEDYLPAWEELAAEVIEPNPFYEPWMLMPALRSFGEGKNIRLVLIFTVNEARPFGPPLLCGLFPLEMEHSYKGIPARVFSLWKHRYCCLCTPLIRTSFAAECLDAFFDWLASNPEGCSLMEFKRVGGDGPFHRLLVSHIGESDKLFFISEFYTRAVLQPASDADEYIRAAISREHRKDLRRRSKRFSEIGQLEYDELSPFGDIDTWLEQFVRLEASGWKSKGEDGGAFAVTEAGRRFLTAAVREAFSRGRLMMLALRLNGQPVAMKCNFLGGDGAFAFKIAFDEAYGRFSPGVQLEIENIRRVHARPGIRWMDSCAVPGHTMINRLWHERRTIQTLLVPTGKRPGDLLVSVMPLIRWLNRKLRGLSSLAGLSPRVRR